MLKAVSAGSRRASWGVVLGASAVEIDIARAAVPAGSHGCALVVDGDGADVLNLDTAEVELEPLGHVVRVDASDLLDLLNVVEPENFTE